MAEKRKDKARTVLKTGEVQRKNGTYQYSWMDGQLKRRFIYAKTLADLREKEKNILKDKCDGIKTEARYTTVNDLFDLWLNLKRGCSLYLYTFIMGFGLPVDFQAVDEYNKYQWRIAGFHSSTYIIYIKTYIIRVPNCCKRVRKSCF